MVIFVKTFFCVCVVIQDIIKNVFLKEHSLAFHCERAVAHIQPQHYTGNRYLILHSRSRK